jgi:hypothetical protein
MMPNFTQNFNVIVSWCDDSGRSLPIDDFRDSKFGFTKCVSNKINSFTRYNQLIPDLCNTINQNEEDQKMILDWIGAVNNDILDIANNYEVEVNSKSSLGFNSSFQLPFETTLCGSYINTNTVGMIPASLLKSELIKYYSKVNNDKSLSWCCIAVWGFDDTPISWKNLEHSYLMSGENDYIILILPGDRIFLYKITGKYDRSL